ncbi:MAG: nitroreductase family protein [Bacillota bacterium]
MPSAAPVGTAAQTAMLAAESLGLGGVYVGAIRQFAAEVASLLELPDFVYPVFGMALGVPDQEPTRRPRLPLEAILHENRYGPEALPAALDAFDTVTADYYAHRSGGTGRATWTGRMAQMFSRPRRPHLRSFLEARGFLLR